MKIFEGERKTLPLYLRDKGKVFSFLLQPGLTPAKSFAGFLNFLQTFIFFEVPGALRRACNRLFFDYVAKIYIILLSAMAWEKFPPIFNTYSQISRYLRFMKGLLTLLGRLQP